MHIAELRFLAVEDHEFQRNVLLRILAGLGATNVAVAADGREALDIVLAPDARVDIIISDLDMPGMDGVEFIRHLSEAGIPVAIILASALDGLLLDSVATMTKDYGVRILGVIEKPVTPAKLEALIALHTPAQPNLTRPGIGTKTAGPSFALGKAVEQLKNTLDQLLRIAQPAPPVDGAVLAAICGGDTAVEREVLSEFLRVNAGDASTLQHAVDTRDRLQVTIASQRIGGASRAIGANALAAVCGRFERASEVGDWMAIEADMGAFKRELERLNSYCEAARTTPSS
jgi:CheY-like chemotaxis protein/HPt (histidine-containing phosphotransfer) domain-containing protein